MFRHLRPSLSSLLSYPECSHQAPEMVCGWSPDCHFRLSASLPMSCPIIHIVYTSNSFFFFRSSLIFVGRAYPRIQFFKTLYLALECSLLTMLWEFQVNSDGTQSTRTCIHSPPNSPPIQAGTWHWVEFHVLYSWLFILNITVYTWSSWGFPGGSAVQNPPAVQDLQETWVQSLSWEDSPRGGHGNPIQYSCLENPMDRGAWGGYSP